MQHTDRFPGRLHDAGGEELVIDYRPSPYLGEHNFEVFTAVTGLDDAEVVEHLADGLFS